LVQIINGFLIIVELIDGLFWCVFVLNQGRSKTGTRYYCT